MRFDYSAGSGGAVMERLHHRAITASFVSWLEAASTTSISVVLFIAMFSSSASRESMVVYFDLRVEARVF
jgi:hypothetical protein